MSFVDRADRLVRHLARAAVYAALSLLVIWCVAQTTPAPVHVDWHDHSAPPPTTRG